MLANAMTFGESWFRPAGRPSSTISTHPSSKDDPEEYTSVQLSTPEKVPMGVKHEICAGSCYEEPSYM